MQAQPSKIRIMVWNLDKFTIEKLSTIPSINQFHDQINQVKSLSEVCTKLWDEWEKQFKGKVALTPEITEYIATVHAIIQGRASKEIKDLISKSNNLSNLISSTDNKSNAEITKILIDKLTEYLNIYGSKFKNIGNIICSCLEPNIISDFDTIFNKIKRQLNKLAATETGTFIIETINLVNPDILVLIEVLGSDNLKQYDLIDGAGQDGLVFLILNLNQIVNPQGDYNLIPPIQLAGANTKNDHLGIAVMFKKSKLKFEGPELADSDYPEPYKRFLQGMPYKGRTLPVNNNSRAAWLTEFTEINTKRKIKLISVHFTVNWSNQSLGDLRGNKEAKVSDDGTISIITGDFNYDLYTRERDLYKKLITETASASNRYKALIGNDFILQGAPHSNLIGTRLGKDNRYQHIKDVVGNKKNRLPYASMFNESLDNAFVSGAEASGIIVNRFSGVTWKYTNTWGYTRNIFVSKTESLNIPSIIKSPFLDNIQAQKLKAPEQAAEHARIIFEASDHLPIAFDVVV